MREQFEEIRNGCPWLIIKGKIDLREWECKVTREDCYYKGCAVLYWLRNLIKYNQHK